MRCRESCWKPKETLDRTPRLEKGLSASYALPSARRGSRGRIRRGPGSTPLRSQGGQEQDADGAHDVADSRSDREAAASFLMGNAGAFGSSYYQGGAYR